MKVNYKHLLYFIGISLLAGILGSVFTSEAIPSWYSNLNKPPFNPPNVIFGPVWTILYILMGTSAYLVYQKTKNKKLVKKAKTAISIFYVQLVLNFLWSFLFFGFKNPTIALIEIVLLWIIILVMIIRFYKVDKVSGLLLIPYILWVSFATVLNASIILLN